MALTSIQPAAESVHSTAPDMIKIQFDDQLAPGNPWVYHR